MDATSYWHAMAQHYFHATVVSFSLACVLALGVIVLVMMCSHYRDKYRRLVTVLEQEDDAYESASDNLDSIRQFLFQRMMEVKRKRF